MEDNAPAAPGEKDTPTVAELEAQAKSGQPISLTDLANADKAEREAQKGGTVETDPPGQDKGEALTAAKEGPAGTAITQIFEKRLTAPDEAARKTLPTPKEGESYFITLHPAYLEKSSYNNFSVDVESENFKELLKSIELVGIKDPVLARFNEKGGLEILSGQRRHIAATMLNQAVPTIIQKIGDADAKIIVADGNLHRDKISSYDLSRALRMKMEGMKQKSGRRKKGTFKAEELDSDVKLAEIEKLLNWIDVFTWYVNVNARTWAELEADFQAWSDMDGLTWVQVQVREMVIEDLVASWNVFDPRYPRGVRL